MAYKLITVAVAPLAADRLGTVAWSMLRAYHGQKLPLLLSGSFKGKGVEIFMV